MSTLGQFVRDRRNELGLTQAALAVRVGVDDTYVSAVETGRRTPDGLPFLDVLGHALELDTAQTRELLAAARRSQRSIRLPDGLSTRKHEVFTELADDLPHLSEQDMEIIAGVHAALVRNRERAADAKLATEGGAM